MEWKDEFADNITRMAAAAYTPKQIAFALELPRDKFLLWMQDEKHPASGSFYKGFYSSELAIRENVFQLARSGSSPAQTLAVKLFDETRKCIKLDGITEEEI